MGVRLGPMILPHDGISRKPRAAAPSTCLLTIRAFRLGYSARRRGQIQAAESKLEVQQMKHRDVYRTELTPISFLERNAYVFPDKTAVVHGSRKYTYRQFEERVNRLASGLRKAGMQKNDRVAFICPNTPAMIEAHYGVPLAGR